MYYGILGLVLFIADHWHAAAGLVGACYALTFVR
jgi:hypothetical protein